MSTAEDPWGGKVAGALKSAGIRRVPIAIPFPVPPVNVYMIGQGEVTLIDCGPAWKDSLERLRAALGPGERIAQIVVTHGHIDHHGAAAALAEEFGCRVVAHPFDASAVKHYKDTIDERYRTWARAAEENGVPTQVVRSMASHYDLLKGLGHDVANVGTIEGRSVIEVGSLRLEVFHTPGHTAGSLVFLERRRRLLFSGDTVLPGITPNPFFDGITERASGPGPFLESIRRLRGLPVDLVLPGHGVPVDNLEAVLDSYEAHHRDREAAIVDVLRRAGGATGYEVVRQLFPSVGPVDFWLATAEVIGHLQNLERLGRVERAPSQHGTAKWRVPASKAATRRER